VRKIKKIFVTFAVVIVALSVVKYQFFPTPYKHSFWMLPFWWQKCQSNFSKYSVGDNYSFVTYRDSDHGPNALVFYKDGSTDQTITIAKLRGFLDADLGLVKVVQDDVVKAVARETSIIANHLQITTFVPFGLWRNEDVNKTHDLTMQGIKVTSDDVFETEKTIVKYYSGEFQKIAFTKKNTGFKKYAVPVFDFITPAKGAIAIIKDKATGKTLFAITHGKDPKKFNEGEFKAVVKSLTFDAEPAPEPFSGK